MGVLSIEQQMAALYEHCTQLVFFMKRTAPFTYEYRYVNPAGVAIFKQSPIGCELGMSGLNHSKSDVIVENYEKAIKENRQIIYRDFYLFADTKHTNETTVWPVFIEQEQYVLAVSKEISSHKVLEEEQHFLSTLFLKQHNPMIVASRTGQVLKINRVFSEVFSVPETIIGTHLKPRNEEERQLIKLCEERLQPLFEGSHQEAVSMNWLYNSRINYTILMTPIVMEDEIVAVSLEWIEQNDAQHLEATLKETNFLLEGYKQALAAASNFCITDTEGVIEYVSEGYQQLSGYSCEELLGQTNAVLNSRRHTSEFYEDMWTTIKRGAIWQGEICNRTKRGTYYWAHTTIVPVFDKNAEIKNFVSVCIDVTERRALMSSLQNIEKTFNLITENTNDFITITNEDGIILYASPNHKERLGYDKEKLIGKFYADILTAESSEVLKREIVQTLNNEEEANVELEMVSKSGETLWTEAYITGVQDPVREEVYQYVTIAREITQRKQKEEELRFLAYHDALTLLPNRRYLSLQCEKLEQEAKERQQSIVAMYIDGDNFKAINDVYGHDVGDEFIREFGRALKRSLRDSDFVCRIGGDEFVVLLTHMSLDEVVCEQQILATIERIQQVLRKGWDIAGNHFAPTSSIGIAVYPQHGTSVELLLEKADSALYLAKNVSGKDSYRFASN